MAVTDAYATAAEYRARTNKSDTSEDAEVLEQLTAVSRYLDKRARRHFTQDANVVTRVYSGNGEAILWLPDDIATSTGLVVTVDLDGDYSFADEAALSLDTDFWLGPDNADKGPEPMPWEFLEVHPNSSRLSAWPEQRKAVQVRAKFGWPAVPAAIKDLTVSITRTLRDMEISGATLTLQNIEAAISLRPDLSRLLVQMEEMYKKPVRF